jgi:hypothetical protein
MTHQITNGYKKLRDSDLITFAHEVAGKMKGNPVFPEPPAALANLEKVLPDYMGAIGQASGGDEESRFIKKAKRVEVIGLLSQLAEYVTLTCKGDPASLLSSGFQLARPRGTKPMSPIKELVVNIDQSGEAVTKVKRVAGAKAYIHQYTTDPLLGDNVWINKCTTDPSYTFSGLKSKEKYWFKVIAIGLNGKETASPLVSRVIQ